MNPPKKFKYTPEIIAHINACAAQGMSLHAASKEVGAHGITLRKAASREGLLKWLNDKFPPRPELGGGSKVKEHVGEMRNLWPEDIQTPLDIDWDSPYVRSAAMVWRGAA